MKELLDRIVEKLEENQTIVFHLEGGKPTQSIDLVKAIEIVKQAAVQYEECYKDCGECKAYDKEKHHCPKFCKVIKEAVKEIEENHNGWIPCSERLPEPGKRYLVSGVWKDEDYKNPAVYDAVFGGDGLWHSYNYEPVSYDVVAWQPLPEPYTKGE